MQKIAPPSRRLEEIISVVVLALILFFTYVRFFDVPYPGFYFNPSTGEVLQVFVTPAEPDAAIQKGDIIQRIGDVSWKDYKSDATQMFFENAKPGEVVEIIVSRDNVETTIPWVFPGFTNEEFEARFINVWWLAYIFWAFGSLTQLVIRPRDTRSRLLAAANYLTGLWVIFGAVSAAHIWGSSLFLHAVTWLMLPVYLHLHWVFPRPLKGMPGRVWAILHLAGFALAIGELVKALPRSLYSLGFLLALAGSIALLIVHAVRQPAQRRAVALLGIVVLVALIPVLIIGITVLAKRIPQIGLLALLALPVIPGAYFYIVYRQRLGGMEVRANRTISIYTFVIMVGTILLALIAPAALTLLDRPGILIMLSIVAVLLATYASLAAFPSFQAFIEQRLFKIKLPHQRLPETYSSRITTSASMLGLLNLLEDEVFPTLLVRQFALLQFSGDTCEALLVKGLEEERLPGMDEAKELVSKSGRYLPPAGDVGGSWIRLILPLKFGEDVTGLWLLGRRDPDDIYNEAEIPILQSLADQTAIAMSNLLQTERLRTLYQLDIDRREQERLRLALELHDSVLNQLAVLRMNADVPNLSPNFQQAYEEVVQRLREIVSDLRPPTLNYGLKLALEELAQDLMERSENHARVTLAMWGDDERYPQNIEQHLFRIVQEACENALRHAKATHVTVSAQLDAEEVILDIEDDGSGFEMGERLELDDLLVRKHFGLAGIVERAHLIGAQARIHSGPRTGTRIQIVWHNAQLPDVGRDARPERSRRDIPPTAKTS